MAATVEGLFKIIDGASGPMQKMERQAKKTDASIEALGEKLDSVGSDKQLKQMDDVDRQITTIDRDSRTFAGDNGGGGRLRTTLRGAGDDSDRLSSKLAKVGLSLASLGKIFEALKMPVMISGVVALVQAISALGGGAVALIPKLTQLVGVAGALPATVVGIGVAAAAAKLALGGLGAALKGTKGAMANLTPQAREFVRVLKDLKPVYKELQSSAQSGLLPGLTNSVNTLSKSGFASTAKRLLKSGGETLGGISERAANQFSAPGFLKDLESVGGQGLKIVNRIGSGLLNVIQALRHVAVAAEPFTEWLSKTVLGWTEFWKQTSASKQKTGELSSFFDRTRKTLEEFGSILKNLWMTFKGIGEAANPLGESLWKSAEKATSKWAQFANSLSGQNELRSYFDSLGTSIHAIFEFVGKLAQGFVSLGTGGGLTSTAKTLTSAIEPLEEVMKLIGEKYGPAMAETVNQLVRLFNNLGGGSNVFLTILKTVNMLLEGLNKVLELVPGLSNLIVGVLGAASLSSLGARLRTVASDWGLIAKSAADATVAQKEASVAATGGGMLGRVGGGIFGARRGARGVPAAESEIGATAPFLFGAGGTVTKGLGGLKATLFGRKGTGLLAEGESIPAGGATMAMEADEGMIGATAASAEGLGVRGLFGAGAARLGGALGGVGRFLGPAAAIMGGLSFASTPGNFAQRYASGISAASFGLIAPPATQEQLRAAGLSAAQTDVTGQLKKVPNNRRGMERAKGALQMAAKSLRRKTSSEPELAPALGYVEKSIAGLTTGISTRSKQAGAKAAEDFQQAWSVRLAHGNFREAAGAMIPELLKKMETLGPQGARILAQSNLRLFHQAAADNPKLEGVYETAVQTIKAQFDTMGEHIAIVNGRIFTGSKSEWGNISEVLTSAAQKAEESVSNSFDAIQKEAIGSLMGMGYNHSEAAKIVKGFNQGGQAGAAAHQAAQKGPGSAVGGIAGRGAQGPVETSKTVHARGGRVPGFGNQDTVPMGFGNIGAPGELVVNKHSEHDANAMLGMFGTSLGGLVAGEGRPHSELVAHARGGRLGGGAGSVVLDPGVQMTEGREPEILQALRTLSGELHQVVYVISGYRSPAHSVAVGGFADDPHTRGEAADIGIGSPSLASMFNISAGQLRAAGLYRQFFPADAHEVNHVELLAAGAKALGGGGAGLGAIGAGPQSIHLKGRKSGLGGAPGALADSAMSAFKTGLEGKVNAHLGAGSGGKLPAAAGGSRSAVERQIAQTLFQHGANKIGAAGIIGNAWRESKMDPSAEGTGGGGLWGFTSGAISLANLKAAGGSNWANPAFQTQFMLAHGGQGLISKLNASPSAQAAAALFMNDWERPGIPAQSEREAGAEVAFRQGYSHGGRLPNFAGWFGSGGTITASRPTLLGIGDGPGTEVAKVVPAGGGGRAGAAGAINIGEMVIHNHRPGDVKRQIKQEVSSAFEELADELDRAPDVDDSEVLG